MDLRIQDLPFDPATRYRRAPRLIASDCRNTRGAEVERLDAVRPARAAPAGATVAHRAAERPADRDARVHRVVGHGIGRATAMRLRAAFRPSVDSPTQATP